MNDKRQFLVSLVKSGTVFCIAFVFNLFLLRQGS